MNKLMQQSSSSIVRYANKYHIPERDSFELDTSYCSFIRSFDTLTYASQRKNHYQPLQALYYAGGQLNSFFVNCYARGFPNLHWNISGFTPATQAPIDSILPLRVLAGFLKPVTEKSQGESNDNFYVVVYWSHYMGRQSRKLIEAVRKNVNTSGKSVRIIYVNNDNFLVREF